LGWDQLPLGTLIMARAYKNRQQLEAPVGKYGAGVYAILNSINGKIYVGSSVRLRHRWTEHRCELEDACHGNRYLQRAFAKEPGAFQVEVLEELKQPDKEALLGREQFWINFFRSWIPENGYNISPNAESCQGIKRDPEFVARVAKSLTGYKHTAEARENMSAGQQGRKPQVRDQSHKLRMTMLGWGRKWTEPQRAKRAAWRASTPDPSQKPVVQLSMAGGFIKEFESITQAEQEVAGKRTNIHAVCKGKRPHCLGFVWKYA
jgi:group I intron endonuclease